MFSKNYLKTKLVFLTLLITIGYHFLRKGFVGYYSREYKNLDTKNSPSKEELFNNNSEEKVVESDTNENFMVPQFNDVNFNSTARIIPSKWVLEMLNEVRNEQNKIYPPKTPLKRVKIIKSGFSDFIQSEKVQKLINVLKAEKSFCGIVKRIGWDFIKYMLPDIPSYIKNTPSFVGGCLSKVYEKSINNQVVDYCKNVYHKTKVQQPFSRLKKLCTFQNNKPVDKIKDTKRFITSKNRISKDPHQIQNKENLIVRIIKYPYKTLCNLLGFSKSVTYEKHNLHRSKDCVGDENDRILDNTSSYSLEKPANNSNCKDKRMLNTTCETSDCLIHKEENNENSGCTNALNATEEEEGCDSNETDTSYCTAKEDSSNISFYSCSGENCTT